jgi:hypothetical protein
MNLLKSGIVFVLLRFPLYGVCVVVGFLYILNYMFLSYLEM